MLADRRTTFAGLRRQLVQIPFNGFNGRFRGKGMLRHAHEKFEADHHNETEIFLPLLAHK